MNVLMNVSNLHDISISSANDCCPNGNFRKWVSAHLAVINDTELVDFLKLLDSVYKRLFINKASLDVVLSNDIRKVLSNKYGFNSLQHRMSKDLCKLNYNDKQNLVAESKKKVIDKNCNRIAVSYSKVIDLIKYCVESDDPLEVMIGLLICSGSRPVELFSYSEYSLSNNNWICQKYLAKKRGVLVSIEKPVVYLQPQQFINKLTETRKKIKFTKNVKQKANEKFKEIIGDDFTLYYCRKLYGLLSYKIFGSVSNKFGSNVSYNVWLSRVLGHNENDIMTSNNYSHLVLDL